MCRRACLTIGAVAVVLGLAASPFFPGPSLAPPPPTEGSCAASIVRAFALASRIEQSLRVPVRDGRAHLDRVGNVSVLHLYGSRREMGRQYGTILKDALTALNAYLRVIVPEQQRQQFLRSAQQHGPHLPDGIRTELKAMAEASGVAYMDLITLNVTPRIRCTGFAAWGDATRDGRMLMGRNAEYFGLGLARCGSLVVVYHPDEGIPLAAVSFIGMVGAYTGINAKGVAFGNMLVFNARRTGPQVGGLAVQLAMREAAHSGRSAQEFCDLLRARKRVVPVNVMAVDAKNGCVVERALGEDCVRRGEDCWLATSNHFRTRSLCARLENCPRYNALAACAGAAFGRLDVPAVEGALHGAREEGLNLQAVVFEPDAMVMHLSVNRVPASGGPYAAFDLKKFFADDGKAELAQK